MVVKAIDKLCNQDDRQEVEAEAPKGNLQGREVKEIEDDIGGYNPVPVIVMNALATLVDKATCFL